MQNVFRVLPLFYRKAFPLNINSRALEPYQTLYNHPKFFATLPTTHVSSASTLSAIEFDQHSHHTLEYLTTFFEDLSDKFDFGSDFDVKYSDGVLTVAFGHEHGIYVINKQTPNKQLWLSSPKSGPKRYDFDETAHSWIYSRDQSDLFKLLSDEISSITHTPVHFKNPPLNS